MKHNEDAELIKAYLNGDKDSFDILIRKYQKYIFNIVFKITNNHYDSENITQEVFIKILKNIDKYDPKYKFSTYIYKIAVNTTYTYLKKEKLLKFFSFFDYCEPEYENSFSDEKRYYNPEINLIESENEKIINEELSKLPFRVKTALILATYNEMSYKEIGNVLGCTPKAVERLIYRGRKLLKNKLLKSFF